MKFLIIAIFVCLVFAQAPPRKEDCPPEVTTHGDTVQATMLWQAISNGNIEAVKSSIDATPCLIYVRANDGRGPLFWAYEFKRMDIVRYLISKGVSETEFDTYGNVPRDLMPKNDGINVAFKPSPGMKCCHLIF
jgi:ankyrin repeat protein